MGEKFVALFAGQANDVLRAILDQSTECIKLVNLNGELEYINRNGLVALGLDDFSRVSGTDWANLWPDAGQARVRLAIDRARRGQRDRFDGYCPNFRGEARWWDVSVAPIRDERGTLTHLLATSRDITERVNETLRDRQLRDDAVRSAERSDSVAREMRHRLKNQLAVVSSVAKLLSRHSFDARDLMERLDHKLQALARAQDLLTADRDQPVCATAAIAQVLEASGAGESISVGAIPHCRLGDDAVQQLALILGELQTNALKYGALSGDAGKICLNGALEDGVLTMIWDEDCGRAIEAPVTLGAGHQLLTRLGSASGKSASVVWHSRGPVVHFHLRTV